MHWLMSRWLSEDLLLVLPRKRSQSKSKWVNSMCLWNQKIIIIIMEGAEHSKQMNEWMDS